MLRTVLAFTLECEDVYEPVCGYDYNVGDYVTFNNSCEAMCAGAWTKAIAPTSLFEINADPDALNYNPEANNDDGSCVTLPVCDEGEYLSAIETVSPDSLLELGFAANLFWTPLRTATTWAWCTPTTSSSNPTATAARSGCYNFFLNDYGWAPGMGSVNVTINGTTTNYSVPEGQYQAAYAIGVETEECEVTLPDCIDPEALNYNATATVDDGAISFYV